MVRIVFDVADRHAVDALHKAVTAAGSSATAPGRWRSPAAVTVLAARTGSGATSLLSAALPIMPTRTTSPTGRARSSTPISTCAMHDSSLAFFTKTLGFRVVNENAPLTFLHCANADHCSIVMAKTDLPTLNHTAFDVPNFNSVMRGMGRMKDNGYPIEWGPGRHGPGNNVFAYFCGPDEVPLEYAAEVQQIDDSYELRAPTTGNTSPAAPSNGASPRRARRAIPRVQRLFGFTADGDRVS